MRKTTPDSSKRRRGRSDGVGVNLTLVLLGCALGPVAQAYALAASPEPEHHPLPGEALPVQGATAPPTDEQALSEELQARTDEDETWLDQTQQGLHGLVWRSARTVDSWMGPPLPDEIYQQASGSVSAAMLWDEFDGLDARVRFNVDVPLPRINERLHLFIGRFDPEEYVTERRETLGVIPSSSGRHAGDWDETMAGLIYRRQRSDGSSVSGSVGGSIRSGNPDPYAKVSYQFRQPLTTTSLFTLRQTVFYRVSEGFGSTTRLDVEHVLNPLWHLRWTTSGTISEESEGVRGFSTVTATRSLPGRRALVVRAGVHGETSAEVPLRDFGVKVAYRTSVLRPWFVVELCTSVMWPRHLRSQTRSASLGVGLGCELYFGDKAFSSRPVTF